MGARAPVRLWCAPSVTELDADAARAAKICQYTYRRNTEKPTIIDHEGKEMTNEVDASMETGFAKLDQDVIEEGLRDKFIVYVSADRVDVAIRGTILIDAKDLRADFGLASSQWSELEKQKDFLEAIQVIALVKSKYTELPLRVHGHSLGGTKAYIAYAKLSQVGIVDG